MNRLEGNVANGAVWYTTIFKVTLLFNFFFFGQKIDFETQLKLILIVIIVEEPWFS